MEFLLLWIQHLLEIAIFLAIAISPSYPSVKRCFAISICLGAWWVVLRMVLITFFDSPAVPPFGYLIFPLLIFLWMIIARVFYRIVRTLIPVS